MGLVTTFLASPRLPPAFASRASPVADSLAAPSPSPDLPPVPSDPSAIVPAPPSPPLPSLPSDLVSPTRLDPIFVTALQRARWPGRCQLVHDRSRPNLRWALDGAHTVESLRCCGSWWRDSLLSRTASSTPQTTADDREPLPRSRKVLIFNCTSGRNARELLGSLVHAIKGDEEGREKEETAAPFDEVVFCTNVTYSTGVSKGGQSTSPSLPSVRMLTGFLRADLTSHATFAKELQALSIQHELATAWQDLTGTPDRFVHVLPSIEDAVEVARGGGGGVGGGERGGEVDVLVAGSLHLVGGVMEVAGLEHAL